MMAVLLRLCALATGTALVFEMGGEHESGGQIAAGLVAFVAGGIVVAMLAWRLVLVMARQLAKAIRGDDDG